jgi:hypothetical protein
MLTITQQRHEDMQALLQSTNLRVGQLTPTIAAGPLPANLLPSNPRRMYLNLGNLLAAAVTVWPGEISHNEGGFPIIQNGSLELWWFKHGPIVQAAWFIDGNAGVQQIPFWELVLN